MTDRVQPEDQLKGTVMAVLVAGAVVLSVSSSALAAGGKGTIGGDQFRTSRPVFATATGDEAGGDEGCPVRLGGKSGVGDVYPAVPLGGKKGINPDKSDASGAV